MLSIWTRKWLFRRENSILAPKSKKSLNEINHLHTDVRGWSERTMRRALILHAVDQVQSPATPLWSPKPTRNNPEVESGIRPEHHYMCPQKSTKKGFFLTGVGESGGWTILINAQGSLLARNQGSLPVVRLGSEGGIIWDAKDLTWFSHIQVPSPL